MFDLGNKWLTQFTCRLWLVVLDITENTLNIIKKPVSHIKMTLSNWLSGKLRLRKNLSGGGFSVVYVRFGQFHKLAKTKRIFLGNTQSMF